MALKTSLIITGDASVAKAEVAALATAVGKLGTGAKATAVPIADLSQAQKSTATSAREVATATAGAERAQVAMTETAAQLGSVMGALGASHDLAAGAARDLAQALSVAEAAQIASAAGARDAAAVQSLATAEMTKLAAIAGQLGSVLASLGAASSQAGAGAGQASVGTGAYAAQLARLRAELDPVGEAQRKLAATTDLLDTALAKSDIDAQQYAVGLARAGVAAGGATRAQELLDDALAKGTITAEEVAVGMKAASAATSGHAHASTQLGSAGLIAEHVVRSFSDSIAAGQSPVRAMTMEMGRVTEAISMFAMQSGTTEGTLGKLAGFLAGPWGLAFQVGVAVLTPLVAKLFETSEAAEEAYSALKGFAEYQNNLGNFIDRTTGKLIQQNRVLLENEQQFRRKNANEANKEVSDNVKQAFSAVYAAGASTGRTSFREGSTDHPGDARLDTALVKANGNVVALRDSIKALAATDAFKPLLATVDAFAGKAVFANMQSRKLRGEITELSDAQAHGGVLTAASVQAQVDLATAHDGVSLARAKLSAVQKNGEAIDRMVYGPAKLAALEAYRVKLTSAEEAVNAAQDAKKKPKKPKSTAALDRFGDSAGSRIADIIGQYNPDTNLSALEKTNKAIRGIDDLIADLGRRRPPGFEDLIASAEKAKLVVREGIVAELAKAFEAPKTLGEQAGAAFAKINAVEKDALASRYSGYQGVIAFGEKMKGVIQDGLLRLYTDYLKAQRDELAVMQLLAQGRDDEATALKQIQSFEKNGIPLTQARKDAILETVEALRAEQRQIDTNRAHTQLFIDGLGGIKSVVEEATQAFVKGDLGQLIKSPGKLLGVFTQLQGADLFNKLFDGAFRDLQDQVSGVSPVKQASIAMAAALDTIPAHVATAADALNEMASPTNLATTELGGLAGQAKAAAQALAGIAQPTSTVAAGPAGAASSSEDASSNDGTGDVVVTGRRRPRVSIDADLGIVQHSIAELTKGWKSGLPSSGMNAQSLFESSIAKITASVTGLFTDPAKAESIGKVSASSRVPRSPGPPRDRWSPGSAMRSGCI